MRIDKFLKVSRLVKRRTVAKEMADQGRVKVNDRVVKSSYDVKLGDVIQTATTTEAHAGEFAGVGYGAGDFKISYKTKEAGYFIVLDSIIPQANYVQGADYDSMITKQLEFPTPEFDAIGYDSIKRGEIYHTNTSFHTTLSGNDLYGNKVFGYIPRYTGHKIKKSVLTGDFVL